MIDPPALALRRRSEELHAAATREMINDQDAAALLLFYAAECGLKSIYMIRHSLKTTAESRGSAPSARSYVHNLLNLANALRVPKSTLGITPPVRLQRTGEVAEVQNLHQAWRYGEKVIDTDAICVWLQKMLDWVKQNR